MESRRIDGHIYEYVEGSKNSVWLIDNNLNNGEVFEEIQQEVFKDAQEGDLFEYINGEYKINKWKEYTKNEYTKTKNIL